MYFINSGVIEVVTQDGSRATRGPGNFFGEGALLHPKKIRSATIRCKTPVHAMEISREYFEQYIATSDSGLYLTLKEKDKIRKRNRAKTILRLQKNLVQRKFQKGENLFETGQRGDSLFLVENGLVDIWLGDKRVFTATPGNVCGEYSVLTARPRNCTATCASADGCTTQEMMGRDFRKLADASPELSASFRDLCLRRDFKKAVVLRLKREFPYDDPREAFDALCPPGADGLDVKTVGKLMREMNPSYTDEEILEFVRTLDLRNSGKVTYDEFEKVFIADIRKSAAI
jgi:CRP-like cAMP-binding protein